MRKNLIILSLLLIFSITFADKTTWMSIGSLHDWYSSAGCEVEVGRRHVISDQQDGLRWNAQFRYQDIKAAKALWIGAKNYYDPLVEKTFNYKVVHAGPRVLDDRSEFMPVEFKMYGKFDKPMVIVDGILAGRIQYMDDVDEVVDTLKADRMLYNVVNTSIGITMTRKIYAFSNPYYDNFFIYDYVFKNTGIIDKNGTVYEQTLNDVYFLWMYRYAPTREVSVYGYGYLPQSVSWGHSVINDAMGEDPNAGDPFRCQFAWLGKHSKAGFDNIGGPWYNFDGRLGAPQYVGNVVLHADKSATDKTDDPYQPISTQYISSDAPITSNNNQFNEQQMSEEYNFMMSGHPDQTHAELVGDDYADIVGGSPGGFSESAGFGPYQLAPGDSIHIVIAEGVSGLSRSEAFRIGDIWLNGAGPFKLPDGSTTNDRDEYKDQWVYTGRDSILQTFARAMEVYQNDFEVPSPPPPPDLFEVKSGGDRIKLKWSNNAESWPNFAGYRIYRAIHVPDTTYELIFECGKGTAHPDIVNEYDDMTAIRGFNYYYYITSFDDGSTNNIEPGVPLESSKFYTMTSEPAYLRRPPSNDLDGIRIVPNPYNIRARDLQFGEGGKDRLMFYNLPPECTIKIFTVRGDLITTIEHNDGSGDEEWNSITQYRQVVVSGVYIAHIETPDGRSVNKKFIIIR